ncbi:MAG: transcriptional regulator [Bacteroidia bacterium]|nr:MAG: transcriptional regulator [Bacteroidia bacterium]
MDFFSGRSSIISSDIFDLKYNGIPPEQGLLLVSEPFIEGSIFSHSVVLLVEHNDQGSFGFILNKPENRRIYGLPEEFKNFDMRLFRGGPVEQMHLFFIHTYGKLLEDSHKVKGNLYHGGDFYQLRTCVAKGLIDTNNIVFFSGYAGWEAGQLEDELQNDFWAVVNLDNEKIIGEGRNLWKWAVRALGGKYYVWQHFLEQASLN